MSSINVSFYETISQDQAADRRIGANADNVLSSAAKSKPFSSQRAVMARSHKLLSIFPHDLSRYTPY